MLRRSGGSVRLVDETTRSPTAISPAVGSMKPAMSRSVVVLPQPDGPSRHTSRPCTLRARSEEHTSELQSRENLVCRLLLEKKKKKNKRTTIKKKKKKNKKKTNQTNYK